MASLPPGPKVPAIVREVMRCIEGTVGTLVIVRRREDLAHEVHASVIVHAVAEADVGGWEELRSQLVLRHLRLFSSTSRAEN